METNFFANFNIIKRGLLLLNRPSVIVHFTSDASANPYPRWAAYGSSKAAMDQLVRVLNEELNSSGIAALSINPGDMNTEMHRRVLPSSESEKLKEPYESALEIYERVTRLGEWHDE